MQLRNFGNSDLKVSPLGFGAAEMGFARMDQPEADRLLNGLLDMGVNVLDTAACYKESEAIIGNAVSHRRDDYVLVTKCGHQAGHLTQEPWSAELVTESIDASLGRLKTDRLDVVLLHTCGADKLENQDMIDALVRARDAGKTRLIGYSGDGPEAEQAVDMDFMDALETSLSIADQQVLERYLPRARDRKLGVIVKRPIANAVWRYWDSDSDADDYHRTYLHRLKQMDLRPEKVGFGGSPLEMALRFTCFTAGVSTAIVGSTNLDHMKDNLRILEQGPLDESVVKEIRKLWTVNDTGDWVGQG
jgi:hypothetical protein